MKETEDKVFQEDYKQLKAIVVNAGLLEKQLPFYALNTLLDIGLLTLCPLFLFLATNFGQQILVAPLLTLVFIRFGYLIHDSGHHQVFRSGRNNDLLGLTACLIMGISYSWWLNKHKPHHSFPNYADKDPDVNLPTLAYTAKQAQSKRGLARLSVKHQAWLFYIYTALEAFWSRKENLRYLLKGSVRFPKWEWCSFIAHHTVYLTLLLCTMSPLSALVFWLVNYVTFGIYLGLVFAPNHKGMPMADSAAELSFLERQIFGTRDTLSGSLTDILLGGLNHQIAHHLFPTMPRNKLGQASSFIRVFCENQNLPYHETSLLGSHREIFSNFSKVSKLVS